MYLLDTNHCSQFIFGNSLIQEKIKTLDLDLIVTSTIVRGELIYMAQKSERKLENERVVQGFMNQIAIYPVDETIADCYGRLKAKVIDYFGPREREKRRRYTIQDAGIDDNDLWIAATTIVYQLTLVSTDSDLKRVQAVEFFPLENWLV